MQYPDISVLMSTYRNDRLEYLKQSIDSIINQSIQPKEIVLVVDGEIPEDNIYYLNSLQGKYGKDFFKIIWNEWKGLAGALNDGLKECSCPLIARMDSDDISHLDRFEIQIDYMQENNLDLVASWHEEFTELDSNFKRLKLTPEFHDDIVKKLVYRNVISHPSIIVKSEIFKNSGYRKDMVPSEDYDLYYILVSKGAKLGCVQRPLVKVRTTGQVERRSGLKILKIDVKLKWDAFRRGNLSVLNFISSLTLLMTFRILPVSFKKLVYRFLRKDFD
ncbi:MAG: glycosyltransferase [bacterium]|nr:glycosyltransferase [bacterium]